MNFDTLLAQIPYRFARGSSRDTERLQISEVATSVEMAAENAVFVAVDTPLREGHARLPAAYAAGCRLFLVERDVPLAPDAVMLVCEDTAALVAVLAARVYEYPERSLTVIGITGTHARSASARMLERILTLDGRRVARLSPDELSMGKTLAVTGAIVPDAADIRRAFVKMCADGVEIAVLELSAYQLAHAAADGISFLSVALTDLAPRVESEGGLASMEAYRAAKARLVASKAAFTMLPMGVDMPASGRVLHHGNGGDVCAASITCTRAENGVPSTRMTLEIEQESAEITLPVIGDIAIEGALVAFALARIAGVPMKRLAAFAPTLRVPACMECVYAREERLIYIDRAFDAEALERALHTLRPLTSGRLCVLLGSVGERAEWRRMSLGRVACALADYVYVSADNPACEDPEGVCEQIRDAMDEPERGVILSDRKRAIRRAVRELRAGDVLLLAGKGTERHQLAWDGRHPFSDREALQDALALAAY